MDHAATTPVRLEVREAMAPFLAEQFGNASSIHRYGREAKNALQRARGQVADLIGARAEEIVFTSGGTEADNFALIGAALRNRDRGRHVVSTQIEHHAVLHTLEFLRGLGFEVSLAPPDAEGIVHPDCIIRLLRPDTILVSVMAANNEIGTLQPIREIGVVAKERGILFHTDAVQAAGLVPINVGELPADLLALSAHKLYGPKGIGALYIRAGVPMTCLIRGGDQEHRRRGGTENVAGAVGMGVACALAKREMLDCSQRLTGLRDNLTRRLQADMDAVRVNGHRTQRLPGIVNVSFDGVSEETLIANLDLEGLAVSSGAACASGSLEPSHVLQALGLPDPLVRSAVRYSLGRETTPEDVEAAVNITRRIIRRLRSLKSNGDG
jgi:cysteine desulfurase